MRKLFILIMIFMMPFLLFTSCNSGKTAGIDGDNQITKQVKDKLQADPVLSSADIHVNTDGGVVKLHGKVMRQEESEKAMLLAKSVPGVKNVTSQLKIDSDITNTDLRERVDQGEESAEDQREEREPASKHPVDDASITAKIKMKFAADDRVSALHIDVDTRNQIVTLTGTVKNSAEAKRAVQIARSVDDVKDVNSVLTVRSKG
jgi:osmotically-inducible protein OsmY